MSARRVVGEPEKVTKRDEAYSSRLNPKYTFDTFVIGASNRFTHAASVAVAEAPAKAYNPLFIYGQSGLGKTHLLHAIGHYARDLYPNMRVLYVNSEEFTNDFINSIRDDKASAFQSRYRNVDVLLIDDIQFLQGKVQTQEEFFHTFNALHNANKQVVITSDVPPKQLSGFEERMRSRFEWGLLTDVRPPDLETRIAILRKKAIQEKMTIPDEVLEFIASRMSTNIRELEGSLIRVAALASLNRESVSLSQARIALKDLLDDTSGSTTVDRIAHETAKYFGFTVADLQGSSRSRVVVMCRQIAMYLSRELTDESLPSIGNYFGSRDATTVMHADRKIRQLMAERRSIFNQVTEITNQIKRSATSIGSLRALDSVRESAALAVAHELAGGSQEYGPHAALRLASLLVQKGDTDRAVAAYRTAIESGHPDYAPRAAFELAALHELQGNDREAQEAYELAISMASP
jgi:chromosomal replication initiator protein